MKTGKMGRILRFVWTLNAIVVCNGLSAGEIAFGPEARAQFEEWRDTLGDTHVTFDEPAIPVGPLAPFSAGGVTLTFTTTEQRYPSKVAVAYPVVVLPYSFVTSTHNGTHTLMGTRSSGGLPDGQSRYEIAFSSPQARVGVMRLWNTNSLTRFYNPAGELLGEHQNTEANEFVAWVAGGPDQSEWVARVEIDGLADGVTYQVGETDDIFFGSRKPDDSEMIGIVHGQDAVDKFHLYRDFLGDTLIDFEAQSVGAIRQIISGEDTLTLKTFSKRYPQPTVTVDYPVTVCPLYGVNTPSGTHELMGSGSSSGSPDGQNAYEIEFSRVQHRVGIMRRWNTNSLTRFIADDGTILGEHQNTTLHEFVGWVGDPGDEATWVKKVVMDGLYASPVYHVGFADDLHFGRELPDREPMVLIKRSLSPEKELNFSWIPAQIHPHVEYSFDLINWEMAEGTLQQSTWTGPINGDPHHIYFRVVAEKLFP